MAALLVIGIIGLALLVSALVFGDVLDVAHIDLGAGDGLLSVEVIGGFLAALGFGGALALAAGLPDVPAVLTGAGAGVVTALGTWRFTRAIRGMATDPTPTHDQLVGRTGVVLTRVPAGGLGAIRVDYHGHQLKLSARADEPVAAGQEVVVVAVTSPTSVVVTPVDL